MSLCPVAQAQLQGSIASILNVVITRRGTAPFHNAVLKEPLATGDNIRTGDRSKTSVLFNDKSLLKINALSDIVIRTSINQRDVDISAGRVYGDMKGPGRFRGHYATAAIRGTKLEVEETPTRTIVRCFEGSVVVIPTTAQALVGGVTLGRIPDFQSNSLIGVTDNLIGARVDIVEGTQKGQTRLITNFDPATGTVTVNQPYPGPTDTTSRYVIVNPPNTPYVILRAGFETYVSNTVGVPVQPYPTAPLEFLGGDELAWTEDGFAGNQQQHLTGFIHDAFRQRYFELDDERDTSQLYGGLAPSVQRSADPADNNGRLRRGWNRRGRSNRRRVHRGWQSNGRRGRGHRRSNRRSQRWSRRTNRRRKRWNWRANGRNWRRGWRTNRRHWHHHRPR